MTFPFYKIPAFFLAILALLFLVGGLFGHPIISATSPIDRLGLSLAIKIDPAEFYGPIRIKPHYALAILLMVSGIAIWLQRAQLVPLIKKPVRSEQEARAINQDLKISEEQFHSAMESASIGMALVSLEGSWLTVNRALCTMLGYTSDELLATTFQAITHPDDLDADLQLVQRLINREITSYQLEKRYFHKNGHTIWILLSVALALDNHNKPRYFISQIQDISERRQMERIKNEFVSTVSHELRTPLTSIRGSLGLLLGGVGGKSETVTRNLLEIAYKNCERLVLLVNDILDMEKIESGQMHFNMAPADLRGIIVQSLALNCGYGEKYGVLFQLKEPFPSTTVRVDSDRLLQVMANLLSNAAKFSPPGGIVGISSQISGTHVRVSVRDHGPGIAQEFIPRIFRKFAQEDSSDSRPKGGTGLGLAISRTLIEHMSGTMSFTTRKDQGTTFYFDLPLCVPALPHEGVPPP